MSTSYPHRAGDEIDTLPDGGAVPTDEELHADTDPGGTWVLPQRQSFSDEPTRKAHAPRRPRVAVEDEDKWASSGTFKPKD